MGATMLKRPTVFVLGAGAGVDVGMPVGEALSSTIASKLKIQFEDGYSQTSGDPIVMEALRKISRQQQADVNTWRAAGCTIAEGVHYTRSIDSYINAHRNNEYIRTCAKLGIAQTIIEHEGRSALALSQRGRRAFRQPERVRNSWLRAWMYVLQEQIVQGQNMADLFKNLCIINFNYDRCIEHFLLCALQDLYQINEGGAAELLNEHLRIYHPYGTIGFLPWQAHVINRTLPFGGSEHGDDLNLVAEGIKTFNEQVEDDGLLKQLGEEVARADRIVFLGFHFHPQNMQLLQAANNVRGSNVDIYATALERSNADRLIIDKQIRAMLTSRGGNWNISIHHDLDCVGLFREYATTLTN